MMRGRGLMMRGRGLMVIFHLEGYVRSIYKVKKIVIWLVGLVGQKND